MWIQSKRVVFDVIHPIGHEICSWYPQASSRVSGAESHAVFHLQCHPMANNISHVSNQVCIMCKAQETLPFRRAPGFLLTRTRSASRAFCWTQQHRLSEHYSSSRQWNRRERTLIHRQGPWNLLLMRNSAEFDRQTRSRDLPMQGKCRVGRYDSLLRWRGWWDLWCDGKNTTYLRLKRQSFVVQT